MKPRKPIRRMSKAMAEKMKVYIPLVVQYKLEHPLCEICLDEVKRGERTKRQVRATKDNHHRKGRGKYLCAVEWFLGVCRFHHDKIDWDRAWAKKHGYILSRLAKV